MGEGAEAAEGFAREPHLARVTQLQAVEFLKARPGEDTPEDGAGGEKDRLFGGSDPDFVYCGGGKDFFDADPGDTVLDNREKPF